MDQRSAATAPGRGSRQVCCALFLAALVAAIPGCRIAELSGTDRRSYLIREDGINRRVRIVQIDKYLFPPVAPAPGHFYVLMVEQLPARTDTWSLSSLVDQTPPWRRLDHGLFKLVYSLTANLPENRYRFIIGNHNPVIVAIGTENVSVQKGRGASVYDGTLQMGMGLRLVSDHELETTVDELIVWDHGYRRVIDLGGPVKLREVRDRKLWEGK